ncbi:MAG: ATP-binding protein [Candidatus Omnitrophota bacterium]|nr:ATP-binding protein [Candidatus Omnitrophota bacterium]
MRLTPWRGRAAQWRLRILAVLRRRGWPHAIRHVLTLWYIGILALILCLFSTTLYLMMSASLRQQLDRQLALQADGVADAIFAFWRAERAGALSGSGNWRSAPSDTFRGEVERGRFVDLVSRWAQKTGQLDTEPSVQLLYRGGKPIGTSGSFQRLNLPLTREGTVREARRGHTTYDTVRRATDGRIRRVTRPVPQGKDVLYLVQVAAPLGQLEGSLSRLRAWLLFLVPLTLAVTSTLGWFLATRALRPVGQMIAQAQRVSAARLDERVEVPRTGDELERLAVTFNAMLTRLERAFRQLRQFSAAASHELRTPLTVMRGELEVALRKPRDPEDYRRVLRIHLDTIEEMTQVVEELLMLARSEAVEGVLDWRPLELGGLTQQAVEAWQMLAQAKAVCLRVEADEPVWIRGEQRLLERIIANLVDNAIRYTPANGVVTVRADRAGNDARLIVQDTGSGIPPEELPKLFDRFFTPRTMADGSRSTGLGLGLCRWIAEVHHGRIEAANLPDHGAIITVSLPRIPPAESLPARSA